MDTGSGVSANDESRSRRKVSRVNYAEDVAAEEAPADKDDSVATTMTGKSKGGINKKSNNSAPSTDTLPTKRERDDNFPMNWQRRIPAGERLSAAMDYADANIVDKRTLRFRDGSTLKQNGK